MNSPLQDVQLARATAEMTPPMAVLEHEEAEEGHVHLPNPSFWPILVSAAIFVFMIGILFIEQTQGWISIIALLFILIGAMGWVLEDPMASLTEKFKPAHITSYAEATATGQPTALAESVLESATEVVERTVTMGSSAWSAHPVNVEIEREGVVLALYGKVELEAQRKALEEELLKLPGVIDVKNFLVAEDALLNEVNDRIAKLQAAGKLEGAKDISALVENYIVSLYGETPTAEMKSMLERELISIPGVRVVINHIGLDEDIPGNLGNTRNKVGK